ncbi:hypothetical protein [Naasia sp. SYSU D00057]|jgi:hypothetical protein|uniref:hypothetical protein n=1 Tax=Naasia sp. SYSU D00057 TaxID=2817380 RepID=UPI001B307E9E|nr:hypothetical protein [Naasia sp. SYSU D00057]
MKKALWLVLGVALGYLLAQGVRRSSSGQESLGGLEARAREFGKTVADAYRARQAELRAAIGTAETSDSDLIK